MAVEWRDIPGFEDYYSVSNTGLVLSKARVVVKSNGVVQPRPERLLAGHSGVGGHRIVKICIPGRKYRLWFVHVLVMLAFAGPKPDGLEVRHLNGDPQDNRLSNLSYGTRQENIRDKVLHAKPYRITSNHCRNGHLYTPANTRYAEGRNGRPQRRCLICLRAKWARARAEERRSRWGS